MADCINSVTIKVYVQENGIIRIADTGLYIGRLDGVTFEKVSEAQTNSESAPKLSCTVTPLSSQVTQCGINSHPVPRWLRWLHKPRLAIGVRSVTAWWACNGCGFRSRAEFYGGRAVHLRCGFCDTVTHITQGSN